MGKNPADQFYWADWTRDLDDHPLEIEGAWIRFCARAWWSTTPGQMTKTIEEWARVFRVGADKIIEILGYIKDHKIGDVEGLDSVRFLLDLTEINKNLTHTLTVTNRRMYREAKVRENNRLRQQRWYYKKMSSGKPNADLTTLSSSSSSLDPPLPPLGGRKRTGKKSELIPLEGFDNFWSIWPKREAKVKAVEAWNRIAPDAELQEKILAAVRFQAKANGPLARERQYIPYPASWLNGRRWDDEPPKSGGKSSWGRGVFR